MKKCVWTILLMLPLFSKSQDFELRQLLLDVEKLAQLKQILSDLKKGYEIVYKGYSTIKSISEGNFSLHEAFLDGLLEVSPAVKNYKKVADIVSLQLKIVSEYKYAFKRFRENGRFTPGELEYMAKVYSGLFNQSIKNLQSLAAVITSGVLRMSDDERLRQIDGLHEDMADKLSFLRHFNNQASVLALQREGEEHDVLTTRKIFGLTH